jgi:hypothetical protein
VRTGRITVVTAPRGEEARLRGEAAGASPLPERSGDVFARSVTIRGNPRAVDDGIAYVRDEVLPAVQGTEGCVGLSMLADRDSGRCIATTAWESEEAMRVSGELLRPMRERLGDLLGGPLEVRTWEIAVLHRRQEAPDGAWTRVTWTSTAPAEIDRVLARYRSDLLPRLEGTPGFCSASLLVDRREGRGAGAVTFTGRGELESSRGPAASLREEFTRAMGIQILEVAEFELVLAHLRVPETV